MKTQLVSMNIPGNIHYAVGFINQAGLADHLIHIESTGNNCIAVFRVPARLAPSLREWNKCIPEAIPNKPFFKDRWKGDKNTREIG